jgi:hypothetical protein
MIKPQVLEVEGLQDLPQALRREPQGLPVLERPRQELRRDSELYLFSR